MKTNEVMMVVSRRSSHAANVVSFRDIPHSRCALEYSTPGQTAQPARERMNVNGYSCVQEVLEVLDRQTTFMAIKSFPVAALPNPL
jgi:hypothetical protein